jgi:CheY-like chemotaxis protein
LIVGLLFVVFWKLSIGPLMRARDRNLLELQNSRERADRLRKQAVQAAGAKSQFLTFVSHELRTPLNGVLGLSEELKEHVLHEVPKRLVENISDSGEELLRLINAMISFTEASQKDTDVAVFIQDVKDAQNAKSSKPEMSAQALPENLRVLAADDNKTNRMVLSKILQRLGVTHDIADDGDTALAAYQNGDYDVVLLDIAMPRMRGTTALAEMLALDEERNLPLAIAITANTLKEQLDEYHEVGFDFCLAKPIKKAVLVDTIANGLAARALHS